MKKIFLLAALGLTASTSVAETIFLYDDTYDLPPPYSQGWSATPADSSYPDGSIREVFVRGEGKKGNFYGILEVNCPEPEHSRWIVSDGFLNPEDIPSQAITMLRLKICRHGEGA